MSLLHPNGEERLFYRNLRTLVFPIILQNLISASVNSADVFMLNYVSESALAAVSLANQIQFLLTGFFFGIATGTSLLVSQYWGKEDKQSIQAIFGIALKLSVAFTAVVSLAVLLFPQLTMRIFTHDPEMIQIGAQYLRILALSYLMMGFSQVYECVMRSIERAKVSTALSGIALVLNVSLNAVFIFGFFGLPKLGVVGVAIATVIARSVELALCFWDALRFRPLPWNMQIILGWHPALLKDYIRYSLPALGNDLSWTLAFSTYSIILGRLGTDVVAAAAVATTVRELCTTVCFGFSGASTVIVGKAIGQGDMGRAKRNASRLCWFTFASAVVMGLVIILSRPLVFRIFMLSPSAEELLNFMLLVSSYYICGQAMNTLLIAGIFRAGGDTRFGLICDTVAMWCIAVPVGFLAAFVLHLPVKAVYLILCLDEFYKVPVVVKKYFSYTWLKNITREYQ